MNALRFATIGFLLVAPALGAATWPEARTELFEIAGSVGVTVDHDIAVSGRFELELEVDAAGTATIRQLSAEIVDFLLVSEGFLGFFETRRPFLCNQVAATGPVAGWLDAAGSLTFPTNAAGLFGASRKERGAGGDCPPEMPGVILEARNDRPLLGRHDPAGDTFQLAGSFSSTLDGRSVPIEISLVGRYANRPPVARIASEGPEIDFSQGGCPGSEPNAPPVEANATGGLELTFRSLASDPDGPDSGADLLQAQWESFDGAAVSVLGLGETTERRHFPLGGPHTVALTVFDRLGAGAVTSCSFHVADTRPPIVQWPGWLWTVCTEPAGATPGSSPPLAAWLDSFTVSDIADPSPSRLAPRIGAAEVGAGTLFPVASWTLVDFRARDASGNEGSTWDWVWVAARPELGAQWLYPAGGFLPGTGKWVPVEVALDTPGCGYAAIELVAIRSNGPEAIGSLVSGATFGTTDTTFKVLTAPVVKPGGGLQPRVYEVEYRATGSDGQVTTVVLPLTVSVL